MKVRIAIAESSKLIELDVEDAAAFEAEIAESLAGDGVLLWVEDAKKRRIGIPAGRVAYVEIETDDSKPSVGFAPSS
ncbi:MAG TPA: DUF3107 family protein [Acidimicrobiia bacterium]|nr:DUF3107 family protein [Acidimicrobiia bacterium]